MSELFNACGPQAPAVEIDLVNLNALAEKVARVHGESDPRLHQVRDQLLSTTQLLGQLQTELDALRNLTDAYSPPAKACRSYRGLFEGLGRLDHKSRLKPSVAA